MNRTIKFDILICCILFFVLSPVPILAAYSFSDDFDTNLDKWHVDVNSGSVNINDGVLHVTSANGTSFPYIYLDEKELLSDSYTFETRFKLSGNPNYGAGIGLSESLLNNSTALDLSWHDYMFLVWPNQNNTYSLNTTLCPDENYQCTADNYSLITTESMNAWHIWKIVKHQGKYSMYLNNSLIYTSNATSRSPRYLWLGNPQITGGSVVWPNIDIDYVSVTLDTPPATNRFKPIVLIPGLGNPCPLLQQFC